MKISLKMLRFIKKFWFFLILKNPKICQYSQIFKKFNNIPQNTKNCTKSRTHAFNFPTNFHHKPLHPHKRTSPFHVSYYSLFLPYTPLHWDISPPPPKASCIPHRNSGNAPSKFTGTFHQFRTYKASSYKSHYNYSNTGIFKNRC